MSGQAHLGSLLRVLYNQNQVLVGQGCDLKSGKVPTSSSHRLQTDLVSVLSPGLLLTRTCPSLLSSQPWCIQSLSGFKSDFFSINHRKFFPCREPIQIISVLQGQLIWGFNYNWKIPQAQYQPVFTSDWITKGWKSWRDSAYCSISSIYILIQMCNTWIREWLLTLRLEVG